MDTGKELSKKLIDWGEGMSVKYVFVTPLFVSDSGKEQRSALRGEPDRLFSVMFLEQKLEATKLVNRLISLLKTEVLVPIYSEVFECTNAGSLLGVTLLGSTAIQYCYNLQKIKCGLYVYDRTGTFEPTVHEITSVAASQVNITAEPIADALDAANALFFPAVPCVLESMDKQDITDELSQISLEFSEKETWQIHS